MGCGSSTAAAPKTGGRGPSVEPAPTPKAVNPAVGGSGVYNDDIDLAPGLAARIGSGRRGGSARSGKVLSPSTSLAGGTAALASSAAPEKKGAVLVAEDNKVCQKIVAVGLKRSGYEADVCASGSKAVEMAGARKFKVILMDINMPGELDGVAATRAIRAAEGQASEPVHVAHAAAPEAADDDGDLSDLMSTPGHVIRRKKRGHEHVANAPAMLLDLGEELGEERPASPATALASAAPGAAAHRAFIIGLSGCVGDDDLARYRDAGMDGAIEKGALIADAVRSAVALLEDEPRSFVVVDGRNEVSKRQ